MYQQRGVSNKMLDQILEQVREAEAIHGWRPSELLTHFAYCLPQETRFTSADGEELIRRLNVGYMNVEGELKNLAYGFDRNKRLECTEKYRDTLLSLFSLAPARREISYYMPIQARRKYGEEVKGAMLRLNRKMRCLPEPSRIR